MRALVLSLAIMACSHPPSAAPRTPTNARSDAVLALAAGGHRSCAVMGDRTVRCWGANPGGHAIAGEPRTETAVPTPIPSLARVVDLAVGPSHACAVVEGGTVHCWGSNDRGALGDGTTRSRATPRAVRDLGPAAQVVVGGESMPFSCARRTDGTVRCWGAWMFATRPVTRPRAVPGVSSVLELAAGEAHVCSLVRGGTVYCWGRNDRGQCGPGANPTLGASVPGLSRVVHIAAGTAHTCALLDDGTVRCWGDNRAAQLSGDDASSPRPRALAGARDVLELALGAQQTCVRTRAGEVRCTGWPGTASERCPHLRPLNHLEDEGVLEMVCTQAMPIDALAGAVEIAHGDLHACARMHGGVVRCWGFNSFGELGAAVVTDRPRYVDVAFPAAAAPPSRVTVRHVECAGNTSCALMADATVRCWGQGDMGQLGFDVGSVGSENTNRPQPSPVPTVQRAAQLSLGDFEGCALLEDASVSCWGYDGEAARRPHGVPELAGAAELSAAHYSFRHFGCARMQDGTARCWGSNDDGQLGNGTTASSRTPVVVNGLRDAVRISAGQGYACAVIRDGSVRCWGRNAAGQLGDGTDQNRSTPVRVAGLTDAVEVALSAEHACARRRDGGVHCWGASERWTSARTPIVGPTPVEGLRATAIAGGYAGMSALLADGSLVTFYFEHAPPRLQHVSRVSDATQFCTSGYHSCVVRRDASVACWGSNAAGQLGDAARGIGGEQESPTPVRF